MHRRAMLALPALAMPALLPAQRARAAEEDPVDVLLVLAVDVSRSVDDEEARLQREGYRAALTDPRVMEAIHGGMVGAIGVAYVEWAGHDYQRLVIPWTRIAEPRDAAGWGRMLEAAPRESLSWTSISGGIEFSRQVIGRAPWEGMRRVIDVSGDGVNNSGPAVEPVRDRALADSITINGLPIVNDRPSFGRAGSLPLDQYYQNSVIGGPGAFLVVAEDFESFGQAVRRKLIREIADVAAAEPA